MTLRRAPRFSQRKCPFCTKITMRSINLNVLKSTKSTLDNKYHAFNYIEIFIFIRDTQTLPDVTEVT